MIRLFSENKTEQILSAHTALIDNICASYRLPPAYLKAVLRMEIPQIDLSDYLADAVVRFNWLRYSLGNRFTLDRHTRNPLRKFDSSTGYGQIFSQVAIEAILFAERMGIPLFLGISGDLYPLNPDDLKRVWTRLNHDLVFNLSCAALNLIHAAYQMTGRIDFDGYGEEEIKMVFSRYNGNARRISRYGEQAYQYYLEYTAEDRKDL